MRRRHHMTIRMITICKERWRRRRAGTSPVKALARLFKRSETAIHAAIKAPTPSSDNMASHSHPKVSVAHQKLFARKMMLHGPVRSEELLQLLQQIEGCADDIVSPDTCKRYLLSAGLTHYATQTMPPIRERDHPARLRFAQRMLNHVPVTVFVDETTLGHMHSTAPGYYGTASGEHYALLVPTHIRSNVIGAITENHQVPLFFPKTKVNGEVFAQALVDFKKDLGPEISYIVMDNAPIHGTQGVQEELPSLQLEQLHIPPYSPDLNLIEHAWAWLKRSIDVDNLQNSFTSTDDLDGAAVELWLTMNKARILESYRASLRSIIAAKGAYTGA